MGTTIGESIRVIGGNVGPLLAFSWLPFVLYFLLSGRLDMSFFFSLGIGPWWSLAAAGLAEILFAVILVPIFQAWHRLTLGLKTSRGGLGLAAVRHVHWRYVIYTMLIYAPFVPFYLSGWAGTQSGVDVALTTTNVLVACGILACLALWLWFAMRVSFVFVEIAIGGYDGFSKAWGATRGHIPKFTIIGAVASVPFAIFILFIVTLDGSEQAASLTVLVGQTVAALFGGIFWVSATSIAYREITGWNSKGVADVFD